MINEKLKQIYIKHHPDGKFIGGGVLDEDEYLLSKGKMMMLMKEVNDPESNYNWDLPSLLRSIYERNEQKSFYRMWKNVSRWALCTQYNNKSFEEIKESEMFEGLKLFATTNLKKTGGFGKSNYDEILKAAILNKDEWLEEIKVINPRIIICGGTFDIVKDTLKIEELIKVCKSGARYFIFDSKLFLDFVHPAYQVSDKLMFAYFKETYHSLLEEDCFPVA